jgi:hypothetical protein
MPMSSFSHDRDRFDELAREFAECHRRGERPSVNEYAERLPERADEVRAMFTAWVKLDGGVRNEELSPSGSQRTRVRRGRHAGSDFIGDDRTVVDEVKRHSLVDGVSDDLLELEDLFGRLAQEFPLAAKLVQLHSCAEMTLGDASAILGISRRTAGRRWAFARAWLADALACR